MASIFQVKAEVKSWSKKSFSAQVMHGRAGEWDAAQRGNADSKELHGKIWTAQAIPEWKSGDVGKKMKETKECEELKTVRTSQDVTSAASVGNCYRSLERFQDFCLHAGEGALGFIARPRGCPRT